MAWKLTNHSTSGCRFVKFYNLVPRAFPLGKSPGNEVAGPNISCEPHLFSLLLFRQFPMESSVSFHRTTCWTNSANVGRYDLEFDSCALQTTSVFI